MWAAVVVAGAIATPARSQAPPPIGSITGLSAQPSDAQRSIIRRNAEYWCRQLVADDAAKVNEARGKLIQPLRDRLTTIVFRNTFAVELLPNLRPILERPDKPMSSMVAMQVLGLLGTENAMEELMKHCHRPVEDRVALRIWAAKGFRLVLERSVDRDQGAIPAPKVSRYIRQLGRAIDQEDDWRVLYWQLDALAALDHPVAAEVELAGFDSVTGRIGANPQMADLIRALRPALLSFRQRFLQLQANPQEQRALGIEIARRLLESVELVDTHWDACAADESMGAVGREIVQISAQQLQFIDSNLGNFAVGQTTLEDALQRGDRQLFQKDLQRLREILNRPPYT
jgi:hypothetical protein